MKLHRILFVALAVLGALAGCREEEAPVGNGVIEFSFLESEILEGLVAAGETPTFVGYTVKISGSEISNEIPIYFLNGVYVTHRQQLPAGDHTLEEFFILNDTHEIIYMAPREGSILSELVENPLPLSFEVSTDETTKVIPEVLKAGGHTPQDFGYFTLGFKLVEVTAFKIPVIENEIVTKISYEFSKGAEVISGEVTPSSRIVRLNDPRLRQGVWQSRILVWLESGECSQEVYRFKGNMTFDGSLVQLPLIETESWRKYYHTQKLLTGSHKADIFWQADPRESYSMEIKTPYALRGIADIGYWDADGRQLENVNYIEVIGHSWIEIEFENPEYEIEELKYVDGFFSFTTYEPGDPSYEASFHWVVSDGNIFPDCDSNGMLK